MRIVAINNSLTKSFQLVHSLPYGCLRLNLFGAGLIQVARK